jgi:oligopeptide transport system substrate-binding protein
MIEAARAGERDDVFTSSAAGTYFYKFNCRETLPGGRKNPLHDARVRRALSMAIDRKAIVENVTRVHQPIAKTFIPPGSIGNYTPPADAGVEFNADAAQKLLAEAGYPNGEGLEGLELLYNTGGGHERTAQEVVSGWKKYLNLNVSLKGKEVKVMQDDMDKGTFTIVRAGWYGDYRDPTTFLQYFVTGDGHNDGKYHNAEYDKLFAAAATETDAAKRLELLRRAEEIMIGEQPLAPIYHYMNLELWRPDQISGLKVNPWNVWRLHQVSVKR